MTDEHFETLLPRAIATKLPSTNAPWVPIHFAHSITHAHKEYERGEIELATMIGPDRTQYLIRFKRRKLADPRKWFSRFETVA